MSISITQSINECSPTKLFVTVTHDVHVSALGLHLEDNTFDHTQLRGWHWPIFLNQNPFD